MITKIQNLNNKKVSRSEIEDLIKEAKQNNETAIIYRLSKILNDYPNEQYFIIDVKNYPKHEGMAGVQHTGSYKNALDNCGRLRKGWKFENGTVVKCETKNTKKKAQPKTAKKQVKPSKKEAKCLGCTLSKETLAYKLKKQQTKSIDFFKTPNKHIANFLGNLERKEKDSVVITITGAPGSMKTRFAFQLINAFAKNNKVGHASMEEHPDSSLYWSKVNQYIDEGVLNNVESPEIKSIEDLNRLINANDIIVIDSFSKIRELDSKFEIDKDLRKKYDGKLFIVVFQQTTSGSMRGGSKVIKLRI